MNKKVMILSIIIIIVIALTSTIILLKENNSSTKDINQTTQSNQGQQQARNEDAEKLTGVWKQVQGFYKNATTGEWTEQQSVPFLTFFYEFNNNGTGCKEIGTLHPSCPGNAFKTTYNLQGDKIYINGFMNSFKFIDDKLEMTILGAQGEPWKIIFEKTIRPTAQTAQQNPDTTPSPTAQLFGGSLTTSSFNTSAAAILSNASAAKYAVINAPFNIDKLFIVNNGYDGKDYIDLSIMQNLEQTITVSSATITLTNGGSGVCSATARLLINLVLGETKYITFVCTSSEVFNSGSQITGNIEIRFNSGSGTIIQSSTGSIKGPA